ncbi:MAG: hypothetical protein JWP04_82 [Belnapia sp.]|nr:hypothetical protein [Belnapia sp.]
MTTDGEAVPPGPLADALAAAPIAALLLHPEGLQALAGNTEAATLLGCAPAELPAAWDRILGDTPGFRARLAEVCATAAAEFFDIALDLPHGTPHSVLVRARRVEVAGRPLISVGLVSIIRRRQAEAALATANRRLEVALAGADLGAWHWDAKDKRLTVSPRWAAMLGRPLPADGMSAAAWEAMLHSGDLAPTRALLGPLMAGTSESYQAEFRMLHAAGHWVWVRARGAVLERDGTGRPLAISGTHLDLTEQRRAAAAQAASEREARHRLTELELLYRTAPLGLAQLDRDLRFVRVNQAMAEMNGFPIEAHIGRSAWELVPDLRAAAEPVLRQVMQDGEAVTGLEFTGETAKAPGVRRDWVEHIYPVRDPETKEILGVGIVAEEATERKHAERAQELLLRELDHRVKNLFAIIGGLVSYTARSAQDPEEMRRSLLGRIQALAQAHDLVRPALGGLAETGSSGAAPGGTALDALVLALLRPFRGGAGDTERLTLAGPSLPIGPIAAPPVALALHELATNAAKYGALSRPEGRVEIGWSFEVPAMLRLVWRESGGAPVAAPSQTGFGHRLIHQSAAQLGGTACFDWAADGLTVALHLPRDRLVN